MNSNSEIAAYKRGFEELGRFGRVLRESEREEAAGLEGLLDLEYVGHDPALHALGEEDRAWTDPSAWPEVATAKGAGWVR